MHPWGSTLTRSFCRLVQLCYAAANEASLRPAAGPRGLLAHLVLFVYRRTYPKMSPRRRMQCQSTMRASFVFGIVEHHVQRHVAGCVNSDEDVQPIHPTFCAALPRINVLVPLVHAFDVCD